MGDKAASVLVAMSGGVDSSVAALILSGSGFNVCGFTCKMFDSDVAPTREGGCCSLEDVEDAKAVCRGIGADHHTFNCKRAFERDVIERFVSGYDSGLTPNPCIDCNRYMKFGDMHRRRQELGMDFLATGHYARIEHDEDSGRWQLLRALDHSKDQSYVLYMLDQDQLAHTLFPLGGFTKNEVRGMAAKAGLECASKPDSQDICFVPDGDYAGFIERWMAGRDMPLGSMEPGPIADIEGNIIGEHAGIARYTIGQRKGIGIASSQPLYVAAKDAGTNTLIVGPKDTLLTSEVAVGNVNFVGVSREAFTNSGMRVMAKCSYRQEPRSAVARLEGELLKVTFDEPAPRTAPGQSVVLYDRDKCESVLAGGTAVQSV